jgi:hypothetical protein
LVRGVHDPLTITQPCRRRVEHAQLSHLTRCTDVHTIPRMTF